MDQSIEHKELEATYRSVSKAAVASVLIAVLSLSALISKPLVIVPIVGMGLGLVGLINLRRYPEELMGATPARLGLFGSAILFVGSVAFHTYDYLTEVPEGYQRISFRQLKDDKKTPLPFSEQAVELNGKKVFLRGYVRPGTRRKNLKNFILVGSFGSCCFGGTEKMTDVVAISIKGDKRVNYGLRERKIAGVFRLNQDSVLTDEKQVPRVFYQIDADMVK